MQHVCKFQRQPNQRDQLQTLDVLISDLNSWLLQDNADSLVLVKKNNDCSIHNSFGFTNWTYILSKSMEIFFDLWIISVSVYNKLCNNNRMQIRQS